MSNFPKKTKLTTAVSSRSVIPMSCRHITTANFMELNIAKSYYMMPKSGVEIDHNLFCRLDPLPVPTFGNAEIKNVAFFVPFRTVMRGFNDFREQNEHMTSDGDFGLISSVPFVPESIFIEFFMSSLNSVSVDNSDISDFSVAVDETSVLNHYKFTPRGRRFYKQLLSLGYRFSWISFSTVPISLLPLFSAAKVCLDWFSNSQYLNIDRVKNVERWLNLDRLDGDLSRVFTPTDLEDFSLLMSFVSYENDIFTSAWDNPNGPNMSQENTGINVNNIDTYGNVSGGVIIGGEDGGEDVNLNTPVAHGPITQFLLNSLRAMTDWMKRKQIVGARTLDRYLATWGITLQSDKLNRSYKISRTQSQEILFGDVTSMADTDGAELGSYAGKGISNGDSYYRFTTDEEGVLLIFTVIMPKVGYYQGQDRHTMHITPFDFFTPEFDNLGVQALGTREVFVPENVALTLGRNNAESIDWNNLVFGFVPRYAEYKFARDLITGDFGLKSRGETQKSWNLMRNLDNMVGEDGVVGLKHNFDFVLGEAEQYNRIFNVTSNEVDHFNIVHNFRIRATIPGKPLYDNYEFENEGHAQTILADNAGPKVD